jgi:hypothetical protein
VFNVSGSDTSMLRVSSRGRGRSEKKVKAVHGDDGEGKRCLK